MNGSDTKSKNSLWRNSYFWRWAQVDSSLERRVKESSTKQVAQNKNHFPHGFFRKFACDIEKKKTIDIFEYRMMTIALMFDLRERKKQKQKWREGTKEGCKYCPPHSPHNLCVKTENINMHGSSYWSCPYLLILVDRDHEKARLAESWPRRSWKVRDNEDEWRVLPSLEELQFHCL